MDVLESVASTLLDSGIPYGHRKSCERAVQLKNRGNTYFAKCQAGDTRRAVQLYTEAIFCAPWPAAEQRRLVATYGPGPWLLGDSSQHAADESTVLATCFGNRSAALYDLGNVEDCLVDIGYALQLGVSKASLQKLHNRRSSCLAQQKRKAGGCLVDSVAKQLESSHLESAGYEDLCVQYAKEKGRYIEATNTIMPGKCVLTEEPFAAVLKEGFLLAHCSHCFKEALLIPCLWCDVVGYCGPRCRSLSWRRYHWVECRAMHMWIKVDWRMQLCLRVVSTLLSEQREGSTGLIGFSPGWGLMGIPAGGGTVTVEQGNAILHSLVTHRDELMADTTQWETLGKMCDALARCFGRSLTRHKPLPEDASTLSDGYLRDLRDLFLHHLLQLHCNSHSVTTTTTKHGDGGGVDVMGEVVLGTALYCHASLFNHSCFPNAICRFLGNRISICVVQRLNPGDEITICYGPQVGRMKMSERKAELKRSYHFDCNCVACSGSDARLHHMEVVVDAFVCPRCRGPLECWGGGGGACCVCGYTPLHEEMLAWCERRDELQILYTTISQSLDREESREALLKCHTLQSKLLHADNRQLAKTRDTLAFLYAQNGDLQLASHYCELSCGSVEATMGATSIELGRELHKLALLFFQSQQHAKASTAARRALSILSTYLPPGDEDCLELTQLLEACSGCG